MLRHFPAILLVSLASLGHGQTPDVAQILNFEAAAQNGAPAGWSVNPPGEARIDSAVFHGGKQSARIDRTASSAGQFSGILHAIPIDFTGRQIVVRAWLRSQDVSGAVAMWARQDGSTGSLNFQTTQGQRWKGTNDWQQFSLAMPLNDEARQLFFGVLVAGTGTARADDVEVLVDGKPVWEAPKVEREVTPIETDRQFDSGSGITLSQISDIQLANLVTLGKVWGFLKYHHPAVTAGKRHWDYDLFRVLPAVLAAPDGAAANAAMVKWIAGLGEVTPCKPCASLDENGLALRPAVDWIKDRALLGGELSQSLQNIYTNRSVRNKQFYLSFPPLGNPKFEHEAAYQRMTAGDSGFQILAAFRFWNIVEYWSPNRNIAAANWDDALRQSLPKIALAKTRDEYMRELMGLIALDNDTHANLWGSMNVQPPVGECRLPVAIRFVGDQPVVAAYIAPSGLDTGLKPGDIVTELDGVPVAKLISQWTPYYADSNQAARLRDMGRKFSNGPCGDLQLRVRRGGDTLSFSTKRVQPEGFQFITTHDHAGPTFRLLSKDVAYLKLSSVKTNEVKSYVTGAAGTRGMIIDIRNYPSAFMPFDLGSLLVDRPSEFVRFTHGMPLTPAHSTGASR